MNSIQNSHPVTHCDCSCGAPIRIDQLEAVVINDGLVFFDENHFWDWIAKRDAGQLVMEGDDLEDERFTSLS